MQAVELAQHSPSRAASWQVCELTDAWMRRTMPRPDDPDTFRWVWKSLWVGFRVVPGAKFGIRTETTSTCHRGVALSAPMSKSLKAKVCGEDLIVDARDQRRKWNGTPFATTHRHLIPSQRLRRLSSASRRPTVARGSHLKQSQVATVVPTRSRLRRIQSYHVKLFPSATIAGVWPLLCSTHEKLANPGGNRV